MWTACPSTPDVEVITGWATVAGQLQMVTGAVIGTPGLSGATANVRVSQGTLALSGTPFRQADSGTSLTVRVIC